MSMGLWWLVIRIELFVIVLEGLFTIRLLEWFAIGLEWFDLLNYVGVIGLYLMMSMFIIEQFRELFLLE